MSREIVLSERHAEFPTVTKEKLHFAYDFVFPACMGLILEWLAGGRNCPLTRWRCGSSASATTAWLPPQSSNENMTQKSPASLSQRVRGFACLLNCFVGSADGHQPDVVDAKTGLERELSLGELIRKGLFHDAGG